MKSLVLILVLCLGLLPEHSVRAQSETSQAEPKVEVDQKSVRMCKAKYEQQKYERALKHCVKAARSGDGGSFLRLGAIYRTGLNTMGTSGRQRYPELAIKCFKKAAEMGSAQAHYWVGMMIESGDGVVADQIEANEWKQKAISMGYTPKPSTDLKD